MMRSRGSGLVRLAVGRIAEVVLVSLTAAACTIIVAAAIERRIKLSTVDDGAKFRWFGQAGVCEPDLCTRMDVF